MKNKKQTLSAKERTALLQIVQTRFEKNSKRHKGIVWADVLQKLEAAPEKIWTLNQMENTWGEPDVIGYDAQTDEYLFFDCSTESPKGRRSLCYDKEALDSRKEHKPKNNVIDVATSMGIELLTEQQYRELQNFGNFDWHITKSIPGYGEIQSRVIKAIGEVSQNTSSSFLDIASGDGSSRRWSAPLRPM